MDYYLSEDLKTLLARNDIELYDTEVDPNEVNNLADPTNPDFDQDLMQMTNNKLNTLIKAEIGDDGGTLPIPMLNLLS